MNMDGLFQVFVIIADLVLQLATLVKEPYVPGLIVFLLVTSLVVVLVLLWRWSHDYLKAINNARNIIKGNTRSASSTTAHNLRTDFFNRQIEVTTKFNERKKGGSAARKRIAFAWHEYRETLKIDDGTQTMLNGIRPSVFFNSEDLGAEARGYRIIPALFVSIGLAATFLGLIAALQQTGQTLAIPTIDEQSASGISAGPTSALQDLLVIASAKFIMSLTGLFCSILLTIFLRYRLGKVEHEIDELCIDIEKRVAFLSLESLAFDQRKLLEEQKEHSQKMTTELIAGIGESLRDELPNAISSSITEAMAPMLSQVGQAGTEGVRGLIDDLANQFSGDVARAMGDAADRFDSAAHRIEALADALTSNAGDVNGNMERMIGELSRTMKDMRDGLVAGADATKLAFEAGSANLLERMNTSLDDIQISITEANEEQRATVSLLSTAASSFAQQIDQAGTDVSKQVSKQVDELRGNVSRELSEALRPMLETAKTLSAETSEHVVAPVRELTSALEGFVARLELGANRFGDLSTALTNGTDAATRNAGLIDKASLSLQSSAEPLTALARGLSTTANATAKAAAGISDSLQSHRDISKASMDALTSSLAQFQTVIERYDQLDEKLGVAFLSFRTEVQTSIDRIGEHSGNVHDTYADALSLLNAVVDQVKDFQPVNRA